MEVYVVSILLLLALLVTQISCKPKPSKKKKKKENIINTENIIIDEFHAMMKSYLDENELFDKFGSLDGAVWKREGETGEPEVVWQSSFGKAQYSNVSEVLNKMTTLTPSKQLQKVVKDLPSLPDVLSLNSGMGLVNKRNIYRIASNTKSFVAFAAMMMEREMGLDLDAKVHPNYINLTKLGIKHNWDKPSAANDYLPNNGYDFPSAAVYADNITFRHLISHTSGLSREAKKGEQYSYGSSRSNTPPCPPGSTPVECDAKIKEVNWVQWTNHIVQYMMPACGYKNYDEKSIRSTCLPGTYYHYSNAAYGILGVALDNYLKTTIKPSHSLEAYISKIFKKLGMPDTVFTWTDFDEEQKSRVAYGCTGGEDRESCDAKLPITDFADKGFKTPPGGMWSTVDDLCKFLLGMHQFNVSADTFQPTTIDVSGFNTVADIEDPPSPFPAFDDVSEEDPSQMPPSKFKYGTGFYVAPSFTCNETEDSGEHFQGAWGTVPGYTSYMISNTLPKAGQTQYAVVLLRSYNYASRLNIGNQARRLLWLLLNPNAAPSEVACPVVTLDENSLGDKLSN